MALIGNVYVQSDDPGAVGYGYHWQHPTTGAYSARNTSNTDWVYLYNTNAVNGGLAPKTGFTSGGAITGVTGWAPLDAPDFTTSAKLQGVDLATQIWTNNQISAALATIDSRINSAINTYASTISVSDKLVVSHGMLDFESAPTVAQTIPRPYFTGDVQATQAECKWLVSRIDEEGYPTGLSGAGQDVYFKFYADGGSTPVDPSTTMTFCAYFLRADNGNKTGVKIGYIVVAQRS